MVFLHFHQQLNLSTLIDKVNTGGSSIKKLSIELFPLESVTIRYIILSIDYKYFDLMM